MNKPIGNGLEPIIAQAIEEIKQEQGESFDLSKINLAELQRRTGISRAKLRRLKESGFVAKPHGLTGHTAAATVLSGYTGILNIPARGYCESGEMETAIPADRKPPFR